MTPPALSDALLAACMLLGAALYTSVGHAGASAYLALVALFGVPPAEMRPTALVLNVLVASLASARYLRAGLFRWRVLWPVLLGALPMAFLGGAIQLPGAVSRPLVTSVNVVEIWGVAEAATAQAALGGSCRFSLPGVGFSNSAKASTPM